MKTFNLISLNTFVNTIDGHDVLISFEGKDTFTRINFVLKNVDIEFDDIFMNISNEKNTLSIDIHTIGAINQTDNIIIFHTDEIEFAMKILN